MRNSTSRTLAKYALRFRDALQRTYLHRLWKHPGTFLLVAGFAGINLYLTFRKVESPPFYFWDLYSMPIPKTDTFTSYVLRYNSKEIFNKYTPLNHQSGMLFAYTIRKYSAFLQNGLQESAFGTWPCDPATERRALERYPLWLHTYTASVVPENIDSIAVFEVQTTYRPDGRIRVLKKNQILSH